MINDIKAFDAWLESAKPGESFVYFRGKHARFCPHAQRLRAEAEAGKVLLFQRRHGDQDYSYIAMRVSPKWGKRLAPNWSWMVEK